MTSPRPSRFPADSVAEREELLLQAATELVRAERDGRRIGLLSRRLEGLGMEQAYWIATRAFALRGEAAAGYKLGYTNAAIRAQMNIFEPNFGRCTASAALSPGTDGKVEISGLVHPRIEPEITLVMARALEGRDITPTDVEAAIGSAHLSFEIVDTRYESYDFTACDNIADGSSAARYLIGAALDLDRLARAEALQTLFLRDGEEIDRGVLANPFAQICADVAWLANRLAGTGESIAAGAFVMTGALTRAHVLAAGSSYRAEVAGFGAIAHIFQWESE